MSEVVTIGGSYTATIHGSFANATSWMQTHPGDRYTAFLAKVPDDQKRALVAAADYFNREGWLAAYDTFAKRDSFAAPDGRFVFQIASYELGALVVEDDSVITGSDQGSNLRSIGAGSARLEFFNLTSSKQGSAPRLPPILMDLIGAYLAAPSTGGPDGGSGQAGSSTNPFSSCSDYDRNRPL
jgi:hypothetical protein